MDFIPDFPEPLTRMSSTMMDRSGMVKPNSFRYLYERERMRMRRRRKAGGCWRGRGCMMSEDRCVVTATRGVQAKVMPVPLGEGGAEVSGLAGVGVAGVTAGGHHESAVGSLVAQVEEDLDADVSAARGRRRDERRTARAGQRRGRVRCVYVSVGHEYRS